MTTYIRKHFRDSSFIPFVDLADLEQHVRWLAQQRDTGAAARCACG